MQLHIFFVDFRELRMRQVDSMAPVSVISDIGGAMGVFLGASLITVAEILVFSARFLCESILGNRRQEESTSRLHTNGTPPIQLQAHCLAIGTKVL